MLRIKERNTRTIRTQAFYTRANLVILRGAFKLDETRVIDIYMETDQLEKGQDDCVVGDAIVQSLDDYLTCIWDNDEKACRRLRKSFEESQALKGVNLAMDQQVDLKLHREEDNYYAYAGESFNNNDLLLDLVQYPVIEDLNLEAR